MVGTCLLINLLFLIFACALAHVSDGTGTLFKGDCARVRILDTDIHVIINGLATAVVGASNYTMQCLAAPTRSEVDQAHLKGTWLEIGVPSARNLRHISPRRVILWSVLVISTVPVHLMWNSVIFSSLQNNFFLVIGASNDMLQNDGFPCTNGSIAISYPLTYPMMSSYVDYSDVVCEVFDRTLGPAKSNTSLTRLEAGECTKQYSTEIQSRWSNVVVVVDNADADSGCEVKPTPNHLTRPFAFMTPGIFWQNGGYCYTQNASNDSVLAHTNQPIISNWAESLTVHAISPQTTRVSQYPIEYCLATEGSKPCRLEFSLPILLIILVCNAIKLSAVVCTLNIITEEHLVTLGDSVSSFLEIPDRTTIGHCLGARAFFKGRQFRQNYYISSRVYRTRNMETGKQVRLYWFQAVSLGFWIFLLILYVWSI